MVMSQMEIEPSTKAEIVDRLSKKIRAYYIFPEFAGQICQGLKKHLDDGDYSDITEGELFALALTFHLQEVNHDEHLWVRWHPDPLPDSDGPLRHNPAWQQERMLAARLNNFGIHKVERLPGNIGYIDIRYFHQANWSGKTVISAMNFIVNANALIIDLRKCTGGYPATVALVASYLFGDEQIHLSNIYWRDDDFTQQYWTLPYVPGERFIDQPVYVLTSKETFSAGEEFASILQTRQRATIIGDKTTGGAHPGTSYCLSPHFEVFIPIGRGINPVTGKDIEGTGISPDISLPQEHAFAAAYTMALKETRARYDKSSSEPFRALAQEAQTALSDLASSKNICPKCGYPNPLYKVNCKNCDEPLLNAP